MSDGGAPPPHAAEGSLWAEREAVSLLSTLLRRPPPEMILFVFAIVQLLLIPYIENISYLSIFLYTFYSKLRA